MYPSTMVQFNWVSWAAHTINNLELSELQDLQVLISLWKKMPRHISW